jgi:hypothetical protein
MDLVCKAGKVYFARATLISLDVISDSTFVFAIVTYALGASAEFAFYINTDTHN